MFGLGSLIRSESPEWDNADAKYRLLERMNR